MTDSENREFLNAPEGRFDFDRITERRGTSCMKYDFAAECGKPADALPLWVADMDFPTAPCVQEALQKAAAHGIFGYTGIKEDYFQAVSDWYQKYFGWETKRSWLVSTPGIVYAVNTAVRAFTKKGESVLIQQPVYYPFGRAVRNNHRNLVNNPLVLKDGRYEMDLADFEKKIVENDVRLFILCSPHNPVGRVWTAEELTAVADICLEHGVLIVSDEIHSDFTREGISHHVLASLSPRYAEITVTCTAPSKTFNLAGLQASNVFISNPELREKFTEEMEAQGVGESNVMGLVACQAAYRGGREWLLELKKYLAGNLDFVRDYLEKNIPEVSLVEPEGTYLLWLDFRKLGLTLGQRDELIEKKAKLWLDGGSMFGEEGVGFERVNMACPRATLRQAMEQLAAAVREFKAGR
ncbi:MAG: pyridoxal phosphate-dependent aminotransferase [Clostridiales bacterium]|nr:pyridoxal phosphate-dependent aminotransferase [Clostridiales bacterium]